jgi:hypothetical protein
MLRKEMKAKVALIFCLGAGELSRTQRQSLGSASTLGVKE